MSAVGRQGVPAVPRSFPLTRLLTNPPPPAVGTLLAWGHNGFYTMGIGSAPGTGDFYPPVMVSGGYTWSRLADMRVSESACAYLSNSSLLCWGSKCVVTGFCAGACSCVYEGCPANRSAKSRRVATPTYRCTSPHVAAAMARLASTRRPRRPYMCPLPCSVSALNTLEPRCALQAHDGGPPRVA